MLLSTTELLQQSCRFWSFFLFTAVSEACCCDKKVLSTLMACFHSGMAGFSEFLDTPLRSIVPDNLALSLSLSLAHLVRKQV